MADSASTRMPVRRGASQLGRGRAQSHAASDTMMTPRICNIVFNIPWLNRSASHAWRHGKVPLARSNMASANLKSISL